MSLILNIRDEVYLRILTKRTAGDFYFADDFVLERTWRPWETLERLFDPNIYPSGKVYVIGGRAGDAVVSSRANMVGIRDYSVMVGFQHRIVNVNDHEEIDSYVSFYEELEETCRVEVDTNLLQINFNRIEPLRDPNGVPYSFVQERESNVFEAYFTAFYQRPLGSYNEATTTTT